MLSIRSDFFGAWCEGLGGLLLAVSAVKTTLNSVFCKIRGYNRKNLYLRIILIGIFCMAVKVDTQKEIIFGSSDPNISRVLSKKEKEGELRKVAPRIYTTNLVDSLENIVRRNLMDILVYR